MAARDRSAAKRIAGLRANTSARTPEELDGLEELQTEDPEDFATNLSALRDEFGTVFLGGCCGTSTAHIEALARRCGG
jgi:homocysteine S-methyltransferase